jgi:hypothetical protein
MEDRDGKKVDKKMTHYLIKSEMSYPLVSCYMCSTGSKETKVARGGPRF